MISLQYQYSLLRPFKASSTTKQICRVLRHRVPPYLTDLCVTFSFSLPPGCWLLQNTLEPSPPQPPSQFSAVLHESAEADFSTGSGSSEGKYRRDEFREHEKSAAVRSVFPNACVTGSSKQRLKKKNSDLELSPKFTRQSDSATIPPSRVMAASPSLPKASESDTSQLWRHQSFHLQRRYRSSP